MLGRSGTCLRAGGRPLAPFGSMVGANFFVDSFGCRGSPRGRSRAPVPPVSMLTSTTRFLFGSFHQSSILGDRHASLASALQSGPRSASGLASRSAARCMASAAASKAAAASASASLDTAEPVRHVFFFYLFVGSLLGVDPLVLAFPPWSPGRSILQRNDAGVREEAQTPR